MRGEAEPFHVERAQVPARHGLLGARPANDIGPVSKPLPAASIHAPLIAARVGPVRRDFRAPWVRTVTTCAICGGADAVTHTLWERRYVPACADCDGATGDAGAGPSDRELERAASGRRRAEQLEVEQFDDEVLEALREIGRPATVREICRGMDLVSDDDSTARQDQRGRHAPTPAIDKVKNALRRLHAQREVRRRRRGARVLWTVSA